MGNADLAGCGRIWISLSIDTPLYVYVYVNGVLVFFLSLAVLPIID
jgi:hypothetical protein